MASDPAENIFIVYRAKAKPGKAGEFARLMAGLIKPTRAEPGCIAYNWHVDRSDPHSFVLYEGWADQKALSNHLAAPHLMAVVTEFRALLAEPAQFTRMQMLGH